MKRLLLTTACAALGLAAVTSGGTADAQPPKGRNFEVRITKGMKFDPPEIEIAVGDTVSWLNESGGGHNATPDTAGDFPAQTVANLKFSPRVEFRKAGTFPYHCSVPGHKAAGMVGKIVVK